MSGVYTVIISVISELTADSEFCRLLHCVLLEKPERIEQLSPSAFVGITVPLFRL
jgi:hypothetical protein